MERKKYQLQISVSIYDNEGHGRLEVRHEVQVTAGDFLEVAQILAEFKKLADKVKATAV